MLVYQFYLKLLQIQSKTINAAEKGILRGNVTLKNVLNMLDTNDSGSMVMLFLPTSADYVNVQTISYRYEPAQLLLYVAL